jgi:Rieske Fe-S protein
MKRRTFLKQGCAMCLAMGTGTASGLLVGCGTVAAFEGTVINGVLIVPISLFQDVDFRVIRCDAVPYDIGVRKARDGSYVSLLLRCTHVANAVSPKGDGYECTLHGSRFDAVGKVLRGPAQRELARVPTVVAGKSLRILVERIDR